jgi:hypothetical protein
MLTSSQKVDEGKPLPDTYASPLASTALIYGAITR